MTMDTRHLVAYGLIALVVLFLVTLTAVKIYNSDERRRRRKYRKS